MPGTDSNSGRCSLLYHSLNSGACWASISTYTRKIPRPFCAMFPSPHCSVAAIVWPRLVGTGPHAWCQLSLERELHPFVMAGLVPAIHVFVSRAKDVDGRRKGGHDVG